MTAVLRESVTVATNERSTTLPFATRRPELAPFVLKPKQVSLSTPRFVKRRLLVNRADFQCDVFHLRHIERIVFPTGNRNHLWRALRGNTYNLLSYYVSFSCDMFPRG